MKDRYLCPQESDIINTTNMIMRDIIGVPEQVEDDLRQELCLFFVEKKHLGCDMQISASEVYNLLTTVCKKYCGNVHALQVRNA